VFADLDREREILAPLGVELAIAGDQIQETLVAEAANAVGMLVCFVPVSRPVIEAAATASCKVIAGYGIGYDNIDVDSATEAGIQVTNVPDYCLDEVADHTMALLLALARGGSRRRRRSRQAAGRSSPPRSDGFAAGDWLIGLGGSGGGSRRERERSASTSSAMTPTSVPPGFPASRSFRRSRRRCATPAWSRFTFRCRGRPPGSSVPRRWR
jgi:lactate dehydrogenase-like 2-hydroxyacid dehydrogenase